MGTLDLLLWLPRVDALEDAEASELSEPQLQLPDGLCASEVLGGIALDALHERERELGG